MQNKLAAFAILSAIAAFGTPSYAQQDADDVKWIKQCVSDNDDQKQTAPVVLAYCTCMNSKMSSNETRSITQWEKANPRTMEACATQAGWKGSR